MTREMTGGLYAVAMSGVIAALDFPFFKNRFWARAISSAGVVAVFAAFFLRLN